MVNFRSNSATLIFNLVSVSALLVVVVNGHILENNGIYKIMNKGDKGVLSVNSSDDSLGDVILQKWLDTGNQKWRAKQPALARFLSGHSYEFKPTSDDELTMGADSSTLKIIASTSGYNKYWNIRDVGEGAKELKNYELETCIGSQGLDMPVTLVVCDNSDSTRWTFEEL